MPPPCADGHALALRGEAGRAIGIATSGAFSGTPFGVLCPAAFTPLLAEVSPSFGAYESPSGSPCSASRCPAALPATIR